LVFLFISLTMLQAQAEGNFEQQSKGIDCITIAILAKDKAHTLPLYLSCIENQTWPASKTYLYIRTNNNNDTTAEILDAWAEKVWERYAGVYFDDSDIPEQVQRFGQHEWNSERLKVIGRLRQESINFAIEYKTHYFVADCDNFIQPNTVEALFSTHLPIVAPLLHTGYNVYSNYHAEIDDWGYIKDGPLYYTLWNREVVGFAQVPVVHCTYLVRNEVLDKVRYDDESGRFEYVIFSDTARKLGIPQYLDTRDLYGRISFAESIEELLRETWLSEFISSSGFDFLKG
jgi:hypothetical protein